MDHKKLLIVEDDPNLLKMYVEKFTLEGFEVHSATNGQQAIFMAGQVQPNIILLDIILPGGLNGFDVLEHLKKDEALKKIPTIMLTNLESEVNVAKEIGALDYIVKSNINLDDLVKKVKSRL